MISGKELAGIGARRVGIWKGQTKRNDKPYEGRKRHTPSAPRDGEQSLESD